MCLFELVSMEVSQNRKQLSEEEQLFVQKLSLPLWDSSTDSARSG